MAEVKEIMRCVCGHQTYPGPPLPLTTDAEIRKEDPDAQIQCDRRKVWQHLRCLRFDSETFPHDYFCEECRPDLHVVLENTEGLVESRSCFDPWKLISTDRGIASIPPRNRLLVFKVLMALDWKLGKHKEPDIDLLRRELKTNPCKNQPLWWELCSSYSRIENHFWSSQV